jgi:excisionase family DNA binding protein
MKQENFLSTIKFGEIAGLNRVQVFRLIKKGVIPAIRVGRNYLIDRRELGIFSDQLTGRESKQIDRAVSRVFKDYGEVIRQLGAE